MSDTLQDQLRKTRSDLYDNLVRRAAEITLHAVDASVDIGKEKTQYFEKLALGCGAAVVAIASFVGSKPGIHLQPAWLLKTSLITLALGCSASMYRNWRFTFYSIAYWRRQDWSCKLDRLRAENACMNDCGGLGPNGPINIADWQKTFNEENELFSRKLESASRHEKSVSRELLWVEHATLLCVVASLVCVVTLCWWNF